VIGRRAFLALGLALLGARPARGQAEVRRAAYEARAALLYGTLRFDLAGTLEESVDRRAGRYAVQARGEGSGITQSLESEGLLREGQWAPRRSRSRFLVYGRESWVDVAYDQERRQVEFRSRSETFLLRRVRLVEDVVPIPPGLHVDDVMSATLNLADGRWDAAPDGSRTTHVVRRRRGPREGPDDVQAGGYRAELVPFALRVGTDPETGRPGAQFDLTRFSSWARESEPARIVFGPDRRPELIAATLMLGTSFTVRLHPGA
jgi:hypothetical protein